MGRLAHIFRNKNKTVVSYTAVTLLAELLWTIGGFLLGGLVWLALFPVVWILAGTVALVVGLFLPGSYWDAVSEVVWKGHRVWVEWGDFLIS